jgi:hypothetical protein
MFDEVIRKYRRYVALVDPRIEKYVNAEKELRQALTLAPISLTPAILYYIGVLDTDPALIASLSALILVLSTFRVLETLTSITSISRGLDDELPFATLVAAAASKTGLEFVDFLRFASTSKVFKSFRFLGERFVKLAEVLGVAGALTTLSKIASGKTKYFLTEYSLALNSGTALTQLRDAASDYVKTIYAQVVKSVNFRINAGLTACVALTTGPLVSISMTFLVGDELVGFVVPVLVLAGFLISSLFPDYPVSLQVVVDEGLLRVFRASYAAGTLLLLLPLHNLVSGDLRDFVKLLQITSVISLVLGAFPAILQLTALSTAVEGRVVSRASNHVRVFRSFHLYDDEELRRAVRRRVRSWLTLYLSDALAFLKSLGDCEPEVFELFVSFFYEVRRTLKHYVSALAVMCFAVVLTPFLIASTISLGYEAAPLTSTLLVSYVSVLVLGYSVSKISLGKNTSTAYPALATLIFATLLPVK